MVKTDPIHLIHNLWFSSIRIYHHSDKPCDVWNRKMIHKYALCIVTSGKGGLKMNGDFYQLGKGDLVILRPGMICDWKSQSSSPIQLTMILFSCIQLSKQWEGWQFVQPELPIIGKLKVNSYDSPLKEQIDQWITLYKSRRLENKMTLKYMFSNLLATLLKGKDTSEQNVETESGMELVLDSMNKDYMKDVKISQLAKMSGYSLNHFTRVFKQQMNVTPSEYLLEQRITRAKQLLISKEKMKAVAEQVGFRDEHYFSRAFKKAEGVAPTLYIKNKCHRIAALYYGLDDHLVTLGLKPIAFLSYAERVSNPPSNGIINDHSRDSIMLNSFRSNYTNLIKTKPDLMITSDRLEQDDAIRLIAPTAVLEHSNFGGEMLEHIAGLLGKEKQAAIWIDGYKEHKDILKQKIRARWGQQSAYFIRVMSSGYRVYGSRNQTGNLLYEDLGLSLPNEFPNDEWAVDIQIDSLHHFNSDHIFLMIDPTEASRLRLQELIHSEEWAELNAVRQHHIHEASDLLFKTLGSAGRISAMNRVATQLGI